MRSILTGLVALLIFSGPIQGQIRVMQSPEGGLTLVETNEGYRIEESHGTAETLEVPEGTRLSSFHRLASGWIAAGLRWTENGNELVLLRSWGRTGSPPRQIEPPEALPDSFRSRPVLLIEKGRLSGLAWLEGDGGEKNAVMASRWTGRYWDSIETVAPRSGEAQLALSGAVLEDGSSLLAWAAVDGEDDEILWSRSQTGAWSRPERVHPDNTVPDIKPAVVAVRGGAVIAWSQYDGKDYRLKVSRLTGDEWNDTGFKGEEGSLYPTVFPTSDGAGFLYQVATPRSWSLIEVSDFGRLKRRAAYDRRAEMARPLIFVDEANATRIRFVTPTAQELTPESDAWRALDWVEQP